MLTIILTAQIPSGKNAIKETFVRGKKIRYPNERFKAWRELAAVEILQQKRTWTTVTKLLMPIQGDLGAHIYYRPRDRQRRDVPGMLDALWHLLEYMEIVQDDAQITSITWERSISTGPCITMVLNDRI